MRPTPRRPPFPSSRRSSRQISRTSPGCRVTGQASRTRAWPRSFRPASRPKPSISTGRSRFFPHSSSRTPGPPRARRVRAYQRLFDRTPTWAELYYYTNMIRSRPSSMAWYRQLSAPRMPDQLHVRQVRLLWRQQNTGGTGSGSGGPVIGVRRGLGFPVPPPRHWPTGPDPARVAR